MRCFNHTLMVKNLQEKYSIFVNFSITVTNELENEAVEKFDIMYKNKKLPTSQFQCWQIVGNL